MAEPLPTRAAEIADAALELLETDGRAALTMRNVAERVGIRAPSLYKHFGDKRALEAAVIARGFEAQAAAFEAAARTARDPLRSLARAYRSFALARPHLYRLMTDAPLPRDLLPDSLEARAAAPVVAAAGGRDAARAVWAFAHGMVDLELNDRFPPGADLDRAWSLGTAAFARARRGRA